jgi:4-hydroxy-2-oxoheptanedioate aldolase
MKKSLRDLLKSGQSVVGTWADGENATAIEVVGLSGFEFVIIDDEHGCHSNPNKLELIRAAENADTIPLFRVPGYSYEDSIKKVLDMGAGGILVPNITNKADAKEVIRYSKFPPIGNRGACPYLRSNNYGTKYSMTEYYEKANEEVTIMFLIENVEAVKNYKEIISVEGIDAVLFGRVDLSVSMGVAGNYEDPKLLNDIRDMIEISREKGIPAGMVCFDYEDTIRWLEDDVDFVTTGFGHGSTIKSNQALIREIKDE